MAPLKVIISEHEIKIEPESQNFYSTQAYEMWKKDPGNVKITDCRTPGEYVFTGHPPMAYNIPSAFLTHRFDLRRGQYMMRENPNFTAMVKARFAKDKTLLVMCRSVSVYLLSTSLLKQGTPVYIMCWMDLKESFWNGPAIFILTPVSKAAGKIQIYLGHIPWTRNWFICLKVTGT
ncbi:MAG: hypothetical protein R6U27_01725 [Desulfobacterales bacterium]